MYRPNFCSECGSNILRLKWHSWTSRRFCDSCAKCLRKERLKIPLVGATILICAGFIAGRTAQPKAPPLVIERSVNSPLNDSSNGLGGESSAQKAATGSNPGNPSSRPPLTEEVVYICGARTKKGTPCSRRVHGLVRCWQHKGLPAMLSQDKLLVKD